MIIKEIDSNNTPRKMILRLCKTSPMPMVTYTKTFNITRAVAFARRRGVKFNAVLCYLIGKAASNIPEFFIVPREDKLLQYDSLVITAVVPTREGGVDTAGVVFEADFDSFYKSYISATGIVYESAEGYGISGESARIGTSAVLTSEFDAVSNCYFPELQNPFFVWGRYRKSFPHKFTLPISCQISHAQMDGAEVGKFFTVLEHEIKALR